MTTPSKVKKTRDKKKRHKEYTEQERLIKRTEKMIKRKINQADLNELFPSFEPSKPLRFLTLFEHTQTNGYPNPYRWMTNVRRRNNKEKRSSISGSGFYVSCKFGCNIFSGLSISRTKSNEIWSVRLALEIMDLKIWWLIFVYTLEFNPISSFMFYIYRGLELCCYFGIMLLLVFLKSFAAELELCCWA